VSGLVGQVFVCAPGARTQRTTLNARQKLPPRHRAVEPASGNINYRWVMAPPRGEAVHELARLPLACASLLGWRDCCAVLTLTSCSTNTSPETALPCSSTLAGLAPRASSRSGWTAPIDRGHVQCGSRFAIPPASLCSGSAARSGMGDYRVWLANDPIGPIRNGPLWPALDGRDLDGTRTWVTMS
jgi:hypothetical protein